jgi:hypothetical protein
MGQDGQRFSWAMCFLHAGQKRLSVGMVTQEPRGRCGKGPLEVRVTDGLARGTHACASRFLAAFDHACGRGSILYAWKAADGMDVIAPHEAEALANTGYRLEPIEGLGRVLCGGFQQRKLPVTEALIVRGDERQVHRDGLLYGRGMKALSDTRPVRLGSAVLADCGQVGWRVGMLHEISVLNVCASEACDAARGFGEHAAAQERGHLV